MLIPLKEVIFIKSKINLNPAIFFLCLFFLLRACLRLISCLDYTILHIIVVKVSKLKNVIDWLLCIIVVQQSSMLIT